RLIIGDWDLSNPNIFFRMEDGDRRFFIIGCIDYLDESLRQFFGRQLVDPSVENNNAAKRGPRIRISGPRINRGQHLALMPNRNSGWIEMLHHRHRRLVEISDDSQPMTSILDIRR